MLYKILGSDKGDIKMELSAANFQPIGERLLIDKDPEETITSGGIHIPGTTWERRFTGTVLAVGNGKVKEKNEVFTRTPLEVKRGDKVSFMHYVGHGIKINGKEYMLIKESELLGVLV